MQRYVVVRFVQGLIALLLLSMLIFVLARATGDPVQLLLPIDATREDYLALRRQLRLDRPYYIQYGVFLANAVKGDFGTSLRTRRPVRDLLLERLPYSAALAGLATAIALMVAMPLGVTAAVKKGTYIDTLAKIIAILGQSVPAFWLGIVLIEVFSVKLRVFPVSGTGGIAHYVLPAFTLSGWLVAGIMRLLRSGMLDVLDSDFVKMARIKGLSEREIIWKHALRNATISVLTFAGIYFALLITMAVVVEVVFAWPGVGRLIYEGIMFRDFPVIQAVILFAAAVVVVVNLLVDIAYAYLDPRIRYR